ncbi:MAG TPA: dienelactone hydrolase family protein [Thermoanaerobaculia bacterium]
MQIRTSEVEIRVDGRPMRTVVVSPKADGRFPGILLYSEIFQLTGPIRRSMERLAGHGFVVAGPEIYHRVEPPGLVIPYDDAGRMRGQDDAARTATAEFDSDRIAVLDFLEKQPNVAARRFGAMGFCIGGHLAFRAALDTRIGAAVCCYPTGLHTGKVGKEPDAGTLTRAREIKGELLVVFGAADPHIPEEGRRKVADALAAARVENRIHLAPGEHAFMRDEGNRYDPDASDEVWGMAVELFRRVLSSK